MAFIANTDLFASTSDDITNPAVRRIMRKRPRSLFKFVLHS